ncbi:MAG: hypothetical protein H0W13_10315 [Nitrospirales bacterium]|nr:hypothetical protein [Nitrospirales bacterium]
MQSWSRHGGGRYRVGTYAVWIDQTLSNLSSEDSATQEAAATALMATGDMRLLPKLEDMRANADRSLRMVIKPIVDLLKNKAKLAGKRPTIAGQPRRI